MRRRLGWNMLALFALLAILFIIPSVAMGATVFKTTNQLTFAWDAVTVPAGSTVQYQIYTRTDPSGTPGASGNPITATQAIVTFSVEGLYDVGVKAQRLVSGAVVSESSISWSNDPAAAQGGAAFGAQYYLPPPNPGNLR